jgi:hypothetical protein
LTALADTWHRYATIAAVRSGRGRIGLLFASLVAAALVVIPSAVSDAGGASTPGLNAWVSSVPISKGMPGSFVGLSVEFSALTAYAGEDPAAVDPVFVRLLRQLAPGARPLLRIGGHSTDSAWVSAPGAAAPSPGLRIRLTPGWLSVAHAVAAALDGQLILGLNLADGQPALATAEAQAMLATIGKRYIDAFEIGNEPDVYGVYAWYWAPAGSAVFARTRSYSFQDYLGEFTRWRAALGGLPIAGPAFASIAWMEHLGAFLDAAPRLTLVTFHQYPLWACQRNPTAANFPSIPHLLLASSARGLAAQIAPFVAIAHRAGIPFRLDELNSAACEGRPGVSDTFASSLWALDTLFALASVGVDGVNIHTLPGAAYAPFSIGYGGGRWTASVNPLYYGLLAFERAFPPGARLLGVRASTGPVKVWATAGADGHVRVALINEQPGSAFTVSLRIAGKATPLAERALRGPSLSATSGVTLGGASFGASTATGVLPSGPHAPVEIAASRRSVYRVLVPAASAILLTR